MLRVTMKRHFGFIFYLHNKIHNLSRIIIKDMYILPFFSVLQFTRRYIVLHLFSKMRSQRKHPTNKTVFGPPARTIGQTGNSHQSEFNRIGGIFCRNTGMIHGRFPMLQHNIIIIQHKQVVSCSLFILTVPF